MFLRSSAAEAPPAVGVWTVPWDAASSDTDLSRFDEVAAFAFSFSTSRAVIPVDKPFIEEARRRRPGNLFLSVVVNDILDHGRIAQLKSSPLLESLLATPESASAHVRELLETALLPEADGLEIDYERIPRALWPRFTGFIVELAAALHGRGKRLHIDLEAGALFQRGRPGLAYWGKLARHADRIKLMCYYERGSFEGSPEGPGPGASLGWLREAGRRALERIPAEKLSLAFSLAGSDWELPLHPRPAKRRMARLHYRQVLDLLDKHRPRVLRDVVLGAPYFRYTAEGKSHEVWFEDAESLGQKASVARELGISHVCLWYLGRRHPDIK